MLKFAVVLSISALLCEASVLKDSCSTLVIPEGVCVYLDDCPSISAMSNDFETPMTMDRLNYLIESRCGFQDRKVKVCCPVEEIVTSRIDQTTDAIQTTSSSEDSKEEMSTSGSLRDERETTTSILLGLLGEEATEESSSSNEIIREESTSSNEVR